MKGKISKIEIEKGKITDSNIEELTKAINEQKRDKQITVNEKIFDVLRKKIGKFEIVL